MANVATLTAKLQADTTGLKSGLASADRDVKQFGSKSEAAFKKFGTAAKVASAAAVVAVGAMAVKSVAAFADFEKGMNEVFTLLPDISEDAMDEMSDQVKDLSKEFGVLPDKVIPSLYQAISAGVPKDNVFEFMEVATKAAIGGATELETAVDGLTSVVNAYGSENIDAAEASDLMFTAVRLGKTTMDELSRSLFQVNPVAAAMGVEFGDVAAAMAAMTAQGTPTRVATTQLRQAFVELGKEGTIASDVFKEATGSTFPEFIAGGGNVEDAFLAMKGKADDMGVGVGDLFGSVEAGMGVISLTSDSGAQAFGVAMDEMQNSAGATEDAFETMDQGLSRSWDKIKAALNVALIDLGAKLAPFVAQFASWFQDVLPGAIDMFASAFDTAITVVSNFVTGVMAIRDWLLKIPGVSDKVIVAIAAVGVALALVYSNPVLLGLGAVAALIVTIGSDANASERKLGGLVENLQEMGTIGLDNITDVFGEDFIDMARDAGITMEDFRTAITGSADDVIGFKQRIRDLRGTNEELWDSFKPEILQGLRTDWQNAITEVERMEAASKITTAEARDLTTAIDDQARRMNELDEGAGDAADALEDMGDDMSDVLDDSMSDFEKWEQEVTGGLNGLSQSTVQELGVMANAWQGLPDKIKISVDKMIQNAGEVKEANERLSTAIATLVEAGMVKSAQALKDGGIGMVDQAETLAGDLAKALEFEVNLGGVLPTTASSYASSAALDAARRAGIGMAQAFINGYKPVVSILVGATGGIRSVGRIDRGENVRLAEGGIVTSPTSALIGEGGEPEAIVPLSKAGGMGFGGGGTTIIIEGDMYGISDLADVIEQEFRERALSGGT